MRVSIKTIFLSSNLIRINRLKWISRWDTEGVESHAHCRSDTPGIVRDVRRRDGRGQESRVAEGTTILLSLSPVPNSISFIGHVLLLLCSCSMTEYDVFERQHAPSHKPRAARVFRSQRQSQLVLTPRSVGSHFAPHWLCR